MIYYHVRFGHRKLEQRRLCCLNCGFKPTCGFFLSPHVEEEAKKEGRGNQKQTISTRRRCEDVQCGNMLSQHGRRRPDGRYLSPNSRLLSATRATCDPAETSRRRRANTGRSRVIFNKAVSWSSVSGATGTASCTMMRRREFHNFRREEEGVARERKKERGGRGGWGNNLSLIKISQRHFFN